MIHDAKVEVTCDSSDCAESIEIELDYVYHSMSGRSGQYDHDDESINRGVVAEGWSVVDGKHYCPECAEELGLNDE